MPDRFGRSFLFIMFSPMNTIYSSVEFKDHYPYLYDSFVNTVEKWPCIAAHALIKILEKDIYSISYQPLWAKLDTINDIKECFVNVITSKWLEWLHDWLHIYFNINDIFSWDENNDLSQDKLHVEFCKIISNVIWDFVCWDKKFSFDFCKDRFSVSSDNVKKDLFLLMFSSFSNRNWRSLTLKNWDLYWCLVIQPYDVFDKLKIINNDWTYIDQKSLISLRKRIRTHPNNWNIEKCPYHKLLKLFWIEKESNFVLEEKVMSNYPMQMPLPWEISESNIPNHWPNWEQYAYTLRPGMPIDQINSILNSWPIKKTLSSVYSENDINQSIESLFI